MVIFGMLGEIPVCMSISISRNQLNQMTGAEIASLLDISDSSTDIDHVVLSTSLDCLVFLSRRTNERKAA